MEGSSLLWHLCLCVKLCYKWYWQWHTGLLYFLYVVKLCYFMVEWTKVVLCGHLRKQGQRHLIFWRRAEKMVNRRGNSPKGRRAYTVCTWVCKSVHVPMNMWHNSHFAHHAVSPATAPRSGSCDLRTQVASGCWVSLLDPGLWLQCPFGGQSFLLPLVWGLN